MHNPVLSIYQAWHPQKSKGIWEPSLRECIKKESCEDGAGQYQHAVEKKKDKYKLS